MTKKKSTAVQTEMAIEVCTHKFGKGASSYSKETLGFRCARCKQIVDRPMTPKEKKELVKHLREEKTRSQHIHGPYWDFNKRFKEQSAPYAFKQQGFDLMQDVEKWAKKYPDRVFITSCDDTHFTSSMLVFITGDDPGGGYWGTNVVAISQCDGLPPKEFFLYPGHAQGVLDVLAALQKRVKKPTPSRWPFKESRFEV